jgi:hypothetical protein
MSTRATLSGPRIDASCEAIPAIRTLTNHTGGKVDSHRRVGLYLIDTLDNSSSRYYWTLRLLLRYDTNGLLYYLG